MTCLLPPVMAAEATTLPPAEAKALLNRIRAAASTGNYQGTMVFSVSGTFSSSRVGHYAVGDQTYELLEALDGRQQRILRHNDAVHTLWPQAKVAVIEKRETRGAWSTTPQEVDPQALDHYELRREGEARIAGRDATVLLLEPRDMLRYAQRLWADRATGLMLRADVMALAAPGQERGILESTAFSEINIGVRPQPDAVLQVLRNPRGLDGYRVVRPQQQRTELEAEGWALARPVAGFRLVGCVRRGMEAGGSAQVLQAVFSDGLTHVSLFAEPFQPERHRSELQAQQGATGTVMLRRGEHWITVVGDVPPATLKLFANALERRAR
ncbi:transcriptional regulator [Rubrivivax rivuli]|uniref:Transcriptional regulator n=2 Tax=Rubrivivax rivuli TaxID=1862385 RepID=A0A437RD35_9BURK|nr:transcriptional regulator [Rubrivivax rivuli]